MAAISATKMLHHIRSANNKLLLFITSLWIFKIFILTSATKLESENILTAYLLY